MVFCSTQHLTCKDRANELRQVQYKGEHRDQTSSASFVGRLEVSHSAAVSPEKSPLSSWRRLTVVRGERTGGNVTPGKLYASSFYWKAVRVRVLAPLIPEVPITPGKGQCREGDKDTWNSRDFRNNTGYKPSCSHLNCRGWGRLGGSVGEVSDFG